jgi:exopolysaccharide biosynthesis polyprenyl glycosylphosphotransferase
MSLEPSERELQAEALLRSPLPRATRRRWIKAIDRRSPRIAVLRGATLTTVVLIGSALMTRSVALTIVDTIFISVAWAIAVHTAESATHSVRVAVRGSGVALLGTAWGATAAAALGFFFPSLGITVAGVVGLAGAVLCLLLAWAIARRRLGVLKSRVLVVGVTASSRELVETLAQEERSEFEIIGFVDPDTTVQAVGGIPVIGRVHELESIVRLAKPDLVVLSVERGRPDVFARLAAVAGLGFQVVGLPEFYEHAFGRLPIRHLTEAWFMSILHVYQRPYNSLAKRTLDISASLTILLLTVPLFPLIALFVKTTRGPIFYRQVRLGEGGATFSIVKFRTMQDKAERGTAIWAQADDPRVTPVGRILRQTRLDELPQLWNVLKGEMSLVGPRPERPDFLPTLEATVPFWSRRHLLKPGLTGWAQVKSGYAAEQFEMETKLAYDLWYLRHRRLIVDVMICLQTLPRLFAQAGR